MPIHDWTRVDAEIFYDFHHEWVSTVCQALNDGLLPADSYALMAKQASDFGPDLSRWELRSNREFYRRKSSTIVVRHVSGDDIVAVVEIISPGNKAGVRPFQALIEKALDLLEYKIHLLILDLFPPSTRDPRGLHSAIWEAITEEAFTPPADKPLTLVAYESDLAVNAYIEPVAVGDALPDMPLFLEPGAHVLVPLEATYREAFARVPARWRTVLESGAR